MKRIIFIILLLYSNIFSLELLVGISNSSKAIWVDDKNTDDLTIAMFENESNFLPTISLRSDIKPTDYWGYFYQLDGSIFNIKTQYIKDSVYINMNTSIQGYSLFAIPMGYINFHNKTNWNFKLGIGFGVSYLNMHGKFKITRKTHIDYGKTKKVDINKFGSAIGILMELSIENHIISLVTYAPSADDKNYSYMQFNDRFSYQYKFHF